MAEGKKTYAVLSPLKVGGTRYSPADPKRSTVDLSEAEADELRPLGVIGDMLTPEQVAERRAAAIASFVATLTIADMGKKNALTDTGRAKAEAVLGFVPDADELRQGLETWAKARDAKDSEAERSAE